MKLPIRKYQIAAIMLLVVALAVVVKWRSTRNVDMRMPNVVYVFASNAHAASAAKLDFEFSIDSLNVRMLGVRDSRGKSSDAVSFTIVINGKVDRSVVDLTERWPVTKGEFNLRIQKELEKQLGTGSQPSILFMSHPIGMKGHPTGY